MFVLILVTSSFIFQPKSLNMIPFETKAQCLQALIEAKKHWATVNIDTQCIDLQKQEQIQKKQDEIEKLEETL